MTIDYPLYGAADTDVSTPVCTLEWPARLTDEEVAEAIGAIGQEEVDGGYYSLDIGEPSILLQDAPRPFHKREPAALSIAATSESLQEVIHPGYGQLALVSPRLLLAWERGDGLSPEDTFGLILGEGIVPTDLLVSNAIKRTIGLEHLAKVTVALETLGYIFEECKDRPLTAIIGSRSH